MNEIEKLPYAEWLEGSIRALTEHDVKCIALAARVDDDQVLTAYFRADLADKAILAAFIQGDAMLDMAMSNARLIVDAAEDGGEEDEDEQ